MFISNDDVAFDCLEVNHRYFYYWSGFWVDLTVINKCTSSSTSEWLKNFKASTLDTGHNLNVHKTFRCHPTHLLNVLCTFNLCTMSSWNASKSHLVPCNQKKINIETFVIKWNYIEELLEITLDKNFICKKHILSLC